MDKPTYLIIEDEPANMKLFADVLQNHNVSVLQANTAKAGIALAKTEQPDLILMDLFLPDLSGQDAIKLLKANQKTKGIPIIAITSTITKAQEAKTLIEGCLAVLAKPIAVKTFYEQVSSLLRPSGS